MTKVNLLGGRQGRQLRIAIQIAALHIAPIAEGRDRGQVKAAQLIVRLHKGTRIHVQDARWRVERHVGIVHRRGEPLSRQDLWKVYAIGLNAARIANIVGRDIDGPGRFQVGVGIVDTRKNAEFRGWREQELAAEALALIAIVLGAIKNVVNIALVTAGHAGEAATKNALDNLAVYGAGNAIFVALIVGAFDIAAGLGGWVRSDDIDHTGRSVLTEQSALRAAQHLDPVQIDNVGDHLTRTGQNHAVDDGRDGRLSAGRGGDGAKTTDQQRGVLVRG